jgi:tetratricopeptide (TPR) repeat protein
VSRRLIALGLAAGLLGAPAVARGVEPVPLVPPPPDLLALVPFVTAPADRPPIMAALPAPPPAPMALPALPAPPLSPPAADRPAAYLSPPGTLACVGAWFGIAAKALECGREKFRKGELDEALQALDQAVRKGSEADLLAEARYWLGEAQLRQGSIERADWLFRQVVQGSPKDGEYVPWALHASGWTALALRDWGRAHATFTRLLAGPLPPPLPAWGRHGLGLAAYALGRPAEAEAAWRQLSAGGLPPTLAREVAFWRGEALGRMGEAAPATSELRHFVKGGAHPLLATGWLRLGWWSLAADRREEAVDAFRTALGQPGPDRDWAEAGLALALVPGDIEGARAAADALRGRRSPLAVPVLLRLGRALVEAGKPAEARTLLTALLAEKLEPPARAWVLLTLGDAYAGEGARDDARTQYDLAQKADPKTLTAWHAALRLARTNFEMREFAQAARDLSALAALALPAELRALALLGQGEAAYHAGDYPAAADAFRRFLTEFPLHREVPAARLSLAWTALRQDRVEEAEREFLAFAQAHADHPQTPDALLLASELALARRRPEARALLDRIIGAHGRHPRAAFARLNRALLMARSGELPAALPELDQWVTRAPFAPLMGRAHLAQGAALLAAGRAAEAGAALTRARQEGEGPMATLGLGAVALVQAQWDLAARLLTEARDAGTTGVAAAADYGLAAVAFHRGKPQELKKAARAALDAAPKGPGAPRLLYVLTGVAVGEPDWAGALQTAQRLAGDFPRDEMADDALERVGAGAASAGQWPVALEAWALLRQRYPQSPFVQTSRVGFAEAQVETGRAEAARKDMEDLLAAGGNDPRTARAVLILARARQAAGDRAAALEAYERAARESDLRTWNRAARIGWARALIDEKRGPEARKLLEPILKSEQGPGAAEAALALGRTYTEEGQHLTATEFFMTAAYVAPESPAGRQALLEAGWSFTVLKQPEAAATVYKRLLAQPGVPEDLAEAARKGLRDLGAK